MPSAPIVAITRTVPGRPDVPGAFIRTLGPDLAPRPRVLDFIAGAHAVVTMFTDRVDDEFLAAAGPQLRAVCNFAVGHNNIDLAACTRRNIAVTNTPDAVTEGTANIAWMLILAVARRLIPADRFVRSGDWERQGPLGMADFLGRDLTGRTILIVGAGRIGLAVAHRARAWAMRVLYVARTDHVDFEISPVGARRVSLHEGLAEADVVSIHTPLTPETRHLIAAPQLARMKPTAILVNTSRGPVVDEAALAQALRERRLDGAGLDVFEHEPRVHPDLTTLDNVVLTPHIGSAEQRWREVMTRMVCANAAAVLAGQRPPNLVNTDVVHSDWVQGPGQR